MKHFTLLVSLVFLLSVGCATKKHVDSSFKNVDEKMRTMENSLEENQTSINEHQRLITDHEGRIIAISDDTRLALSRIEGVERMAMGKLLYQVTLDSDAVKFDLGKAQLSDSGKGVLDTLVAQLIQDNKSVFIEIQGHTDSTGDEELNYNLGLKRAEAVRRYLSEKGIPLHRMSPISHGESKPIADNATREGRAMNRRVVLLVLE